MPMRKYGVEGRNDMHSKRKNPEASLGVFNNGVLPNYFFGNNYFLFTLVMYLCSAMVMDGVSGVGA